MTDLANIQRWFTAIMVKPGRLNDKIHLADRFYQLDHSSLVASDDLLPAAERIGIYARGYQLRLLECMRAEFPALQKLLGEDIFKVFINSYLVNVPSTSPDLFDLGENLPLFLKASREGANIQGVTDPVMLELPVELAQLERAVAEVSRCKGIEHQKYGREDNEQKLWPLVPENYSVSPALRLLELQFSLIEYVLNVHHNKEVTPPAQRNCLVAVSRKNYAVRMNELEPWQWHFLKTLQTCHNYSTSIAQTARVTNIPADVLMADLFLWIPLAVETGFIF